MSRYLEKFLLFFNDFITINLTFILWCQLRQEAGFMAVANMSENIILSLILFSFWYLLFVFFGLHRIQFTHSRIDEILDVVKVVSIGTLLIFILTMDVSHDLSTPVKTSRLFIVIYWAMMVFFVGSGRVILRSIHRKLLQKGIGHRRTAIIGWGKKAKDVLDMIQGAPALGYNVIGFVTSKEVSVGSVYQGVPVLGQLESLYNLIQSHEIQEVVVALPGHSERMLEEVIGQCNGTNVGIKIVPDLYDVIIGQVRTNQIYGLPLIEILPELMPPWERLIKRAGDFCWSLVGTLLFSPFGIIIGLLIKLTSKGPIFYTQTRVGMNGKQFKVIKFRTMVQDAEKHSGPVWADKNDTRITPIGRILRKLRLDEFPQLINVLKGDMALVGPRPERPYFVEQLKEMFPLYTRRLRVRPGITGWAQVKGEYDQSLEQVKHKLEYDLFYLENMSLRMDLKIILNTVYVMLAGKGH